MLKPVEMRELRIVTLDEHVDGVIKRIDALGSVHLTDIKEFLNVWEGLVEPSKADEMLIKASELLVRIDNLIALLQPPQESKKSLKEMLFQEQEDEKGAGKTEVVGISLEAIDPEFTKLEKRVNELITNKDSLIEDSSKAKELLRVLRVLDDFGVDLGFVGAKDIITVHLGKLPESDLEALTGSLEAVVGANYFVESRQVPDGEDEVVFALVVTLTEDIEAVDRVLMRLDFEPWQRPEVELPERIKDAITDVETKIKQQADAIKGTEREVAEIRKTKFADLLAMQEFVQIEDNKAKVKVLFGHSERVRVIEGWTPKKEVENVTEGIREETGGFSMVEVIKPKRDDVRVPSLLKNPRILKPFESIINMYGRPLYKDIDPTLITAIMFPILFGLMFPDIGHGLIILLLGLALMFAFKGLDKEIRSAGIIVVLCGLCAVVAGVLFGEFFGFSHYASELIHDSMGMEIPNWLLLKPLWFEPIPEVEFMFVVVMLIGALHMGLGLCLNVANKLSEKDYFEVRGGFVKLWCLFGALYFLLLLFGFHFTELQDNNMPLLLRNITIYLLLPIFALFALKVIAELKHEAGGGDHDAGGKKEKLGVMDYLIILIDGVIDALLENFFRFLANIVSYGRILALALCHAALIEVFLLLTFMCLGLHVVLATVVFLAGTVVVIALEAIMAGIHTIRLHFYEWFTKFYEGGGIEFSPFKLR